MMDDDGNFFSYTNSQYLNETKRLKYQTLLKNYRDKIGITSIEDELKQYNLKPVIRKVSKIHKCENKSK